MARRAPRRAGRTSQRSGQGADIGPAREADGDVGGKELDIAPGGLVAGVGDQRRNHLHVGCRHRGGLPPHENRELVIHGARPAAVPGRPP